MDTANLINEILVVAKNKIDCDWSFCYLLTANAQLFYDYFVEELIYSCVVFGRSLIFWLENRREHSQYRLFCHEESTTLKNYFLIVEVFSRL